MSDQDNNGITKLGCVNHDCDKCKTQRTWVGLTDEDVIASSTSSTYMDELDAWVFARDIEAKLKEKNT